MTALIPPRFEGHIRLRDGRKLGFAEFGPTGGQALLWFHGTPGARLQIAPEARELAEQMHIRIISVERPGIGDSTPHRYQDLTGFAADVAELCDALELNQVAVAGLSGGGPYALACAHQLPERVCAAAILGGVAPTAGPEAAPGAASTSWRVFGAVARVVHKPLGGFLRGAISTLKPWADNAVNLFAEAMPPGDKAIFADPAVRQMFTSDLIQGSRNHMQALFFDSILFGKEWGFKVSDISPQVLLIYGDADTIVPVEHANHMARQIPQAELRMRAGQGHLGGLAASREIFEFAQARWPADG